MEMETDVVVCDLNRDIHLEADRQLKGDILLENINSNCYYYLGFGPYPRVECQKINCGISGCKQLNIINMHKYQLNRLKGFLDMLSRLRNSDELGWKERFSSDLSKPEKPDGVELYETINAAIGLNVGELYKRKKNVSDYNKMIDPYTEQQFQYIFECDVDPILCTFDSKLQSDESIKISSNYSVYVQNSAEHINTFGVKTYNPYEQFVNEQKLKRTQQEIQYLFDTNYNKIQTAEVDIEYDADFAVLADDKYQFTKQFNQNIGTHNFNLFFDNRFIKDHWLSKESDHIMGLIKIIKQPDINKKSEEKLPYD